MISSHTPFWLSDFCILLKSINIIPFNNSTNENYNALTRLIILLTLVSYAFDDTNHILLLYGAYAVLFIAFIYLFLNSQSSKNGLVSNKELLAVKPMPLKPLPLQNSYEPVQKNGQPVYPLGLDKTIFNSV